MRKQNRCIRPSFVLPAVLIVLSLGLLAPSASAQLSQLEFDNRPMKPKAMKKVPKEVLDRIFAGKKFVQPPKITRSYSRARLISSPGLLENPYEGEEQESPKAAEPAPEAPPVSKGLRTEKLSVLDDARHILPRIKGPYTDRSNSSKITTQRFWTRGAGEGCGSVAKPQALKDKAAAVKEMLYRFTGSNDYYESQSAACQNHCAAQVEEAVLSGIALFTGDDGSFEITNKKRECRYQLAKAPEGEWHTLDGTKTACSCIPK